MQLKISTKTWIDVLTGAVVVLGVVTLLVLRQEPSHGPHAAQVWQPTEAAVRLSLDELPEQDGVSDTERRVAETSALASANFDSTAVADSCEVLLSCLDRESKPLEGVDLYRVVAGSVELLGKSGPDGSLVARVQQGSKLRFIGRHELFVGESDPVHQDCPKEITIRMRPTSCIEGMVELEHGIPTGAGFHVLAFRQDEVFPDSNASAQALAGNPLRPFATTREDGTFRMAGIDPAQTYRLSAGGKGFVAAEQPTGVRAGDTGVVIVLSQLYGAVVTLREVNGSSVGGTPHSLLAFRTELADGLGGTSGRLVSKQDAVLAGVSPPQSHDAVLGQHEFYYVSNSASGRVGPIRYELDIHGYEPVRAEFWAEPVLAGLVRYTVEVTRSASGFGALRIRLAGVQPQSRLTRDAWPFAILELWPTDSDAKLEFSIADLSSGSVLLDGVPMGDYLARIRTSHGFFRYPESGTIPVSIGTSESTLDLDLSSTGSILVELLDGKGEPYTGYSFLEFYSVVPKGKRLGTSAQREAPYVLSALPPGTYEVRIGLPGLFFHREGALANTQITEQVVVKSGECSFLRFSAPPE